MSVLQRVKQKTTLLVIGGFALLLLLAGFGGFFFWKYMSLKDSNAGTDDKRKSAEVVKQVNTIYKLPIGEEPTVAEVKDKSKLAGNAFFKDAQNGDYVLIYQKAKIALLYRKNERRLINVAPVDLNAGQTAGAATEKQ